MEAREIKYIMFIYISFDANRSFIHYGLIYLFSLVVGQISHYKIWFAVTPILYSMENRGVCY